MEEILRAYVGDLGADWDLHLSAAEYAVNNSPARATGIKPFVMMYGESPSTQLDYFVQQVLESEGVKAGHSPQAKRFVLALAAAYASGAGEDTDGQGGRPRGLREALAGPTSIPDRATDYALL